MSISLFIGYRDSRKEDRLIPVASEETFVRLWRPLCTALRLRWVSRFQDGWMLADPDIAHVVGELERFLQYVEQTARLEDTSGDLKPRLELLLSELKEIDRNKDADVFVGSAFQGRRRMASFHRADFFSNPAPSRVRRPAAIRKTSTSLPAPVRSESPVFAVAPVTKNLPAGDRPITMFFRSLFERRPYRPASWRTVMDDFNSHSS